VFQLGRPIEIGISNTMIMTFSTLLLILASHAVVIPLCKFKGGKYYGIYLFTIFVTFTTLNIVSEFTDIFD